MKNHFLRCLLLTLALVMLCSTAGASYIDRGTLVALPPSDLVFVMPDDMTITSMEMFSLAFVSDEMTVAVSLETDLTMEECHASIGGDELFAAEPFEINGVKSYLLAPKVEASVQFITLHQAGDGPVLSLFYIPADFSNVDRNIEIAQLIISNVRNRQYVYEQDMQGGWTDYYNNPNTGLRMSVPSSLVDQIVSMEVNNVLVNDFLTMYVYSYQGEIDAYMNKLPYEQGGYTTIVDESKSGVDLYYFGMPSPTVDLPLAYIVAVGQNGTLLEFVVYLHNADDVAIAQQYLTDMLSTLAFE